ncbi:hypothetical protein JYB62_08045 [Algoriphagus lutimaris]|uniref:hypothetical protein n=1 Tax=Algoriphagus lutimaris TaxID=613197 RepID=UPI00196BAC55|nr:hypothetical protein [Algoriphagus lutimaris]MBN3519952.1 hypothetical protein [Algoriphagus lutimaris]
MKTIRIFIASSSELKEDRDQFRNFISQQNDFLHKKGLYLELVQWENFLDAISDSRLQNEYNEAIRNCDIVLCLFFTKVGKYTAEEFDTAYQVFKEKGKPRIWTYFKNAQINTGSITDEINTLLAFKKKIGDLGHFYTEYTNIDNLINQYRFQLDKFLAIYEEEISSWKDPIANKKGGQESQVEQVFFNEELTKRLLEAISKHNKKAADFLGANSDWAENPQLVRTAKRIIINGYVGVIGVQIRKLMSIGEEPFSASKLTRYIENCQLAAKRSLQLISYSLISTLWDHHLEKKPEFSPMQKEAIVKFFKNAAEEDLMGLLELMENLITAFKDNKLGFLISESLEILPQLQEGTAFYQACEQLMELQKSAKGKELSGKDCLDAEENLAVILGDLSFLAEYRMISINEIDFNQQRNDEEGLYLHNYTFLVGESHANNTGQSNVRRESSPVISHAVILFKDNYRKNINLDPFIIDYNGLALTGGSKICFYSYCNTYDDGNLNFKFIEDNSNVVIKKSNNPKPDEEDLNALNKWLSKKENRKDMNFDKVYSLFYHAKKTLTGIEEETTEDLF